MEKMKLVEVVEMGWVGLRYKHDSIEEREKSRVEKGFSCASVDEKKCKDCTLVVKGAKIFQCSKSTEWFC